MHDESEAAELDALIDDDMIDAFCEGIDHAFEDVIGAKVSSVELL